MNSGFSLAINHYDTSPEPMAMALVFDEVPLFIELTDKCHIIKRGLVGGYLPWVEFFKVRRTVLMPTLSTRAVSRTPAPLRAISTILSFTPGLRAS